MRIAGRPSLVPAHRQIIRFNQERSHARLKCLVTGIEHAHPVHPAIDRVRHHLIQSSEVVVAKGAAAFSHAVPAALVRGLPEAEERVKRLLADADVQAKDRRAIEVGELVIEIACHQRHKRETMIRRNATIRVVEEEAVVRVVRHIHALKRLSDISSNLSFVHRYESFPDWLLR